MTSTSPTEGEQSLRPVIDSAAYWDKRYQLGHTSGAGSYGPYAEFKATFVNHVIASHEFSSVIEWGCGDGNQLSLLKIPRYLGVDVSPTAIRACITQFRGDKSKSFLGYTKGLLQDPAGFIRADMTMSLEVIFHLTEDDVFDDYMRNLFRSAVRYVVIFASNVEKPADGHMRERRFSEWIAENAKEWRLDCHLDGPRRKRGVSSDFFCYSPVSQGAELGHS